MKQQPRPQMLLRQKCLKNAYDPNVISNELNSHLRNARCPACHILCQVYRLQKLILTLSGQNTTEGGITVALYHNPAKIGGF
jgi:hypothetical protein